MTPELIDRYATMDAIPAPTDADEAEYYGKICDVIETMPTIEAKPVRHGRWIFVGEETMHDGWTYRKYKCSECNFLTVEAINFCQNCSADMREVSEDA
jgi:hypothetical protein